MAFPAEVWGREEPHGADPDTCMPAGLDTSVLGEGGTGEISARLAKSLGLPSAGEGQAGARRAGRPRFLPRAWSLWQQGRVSSSLSSGPNKGGCWSQRKAALLPGVRPWLCSCLFFHPRRPFGPLSPDRLFRGRPQGFELEAREPGSKRPARLNLCPPPGTPGSLWRTGACP